MKGLVEMKKNNFFAILLSLIMLMSCVNVNFIAEAKSDKQYIVSFKSEAGKNRLKNDKNKNRRVRNDFKNQKAVVIELNEQGLSQS